MKTLLLISNPAIGGTETFLLSATPHLEKNGCRVDIVNLWRDSLMKKHALRSGLSYKELAGNRRFICLKELTQVVDFVQHNNYDIVMGFGLRVSLILRLIKPFLRNTPVVIGLRGIDLWRKWYHSWLDRLTHRGCDLFVANSDAVAKIHIEREKIPGDKIVVIQNGIALDEFDRSEFQNIDKQKFALPHDKTIITTVANLRYEKGHDFYLDVIERFLKELKDVHFVWVGDGPLKPEFEARIKSIDASDKFTLPGKVDDVRPLLGCTDIFVLPSREEGMPRAVMEAMAMSLPVVATDVGGVKEVIEDGVSGLMAKFGDIENFGRQIVKLVNDEELRHKMATAARIQMAENFDIKKVAQQYSKLFELVSAGSRNALKIQVAIQE